jgi:DNA-binding NtrC family response regulator
MMTGMSPYASTEGETTILLVDDDELVRDLIREILELGGYHVISAGGGVEALEKSRSHGGVIELILTDVVMPWMNGPELVEQLVVKRPEIRVLYMSGFADRMLLRSGILQPDSAFITKPFAPASLYGAVNDILARRGNPLLRRQELPPPVAPV